MVLIVEDDVDDRFMIERAMASAVPSVVSVIATNAAEAIAKLADPDIAQRVRLILVDYRLRGTGGIELIKEICVAKPDIGVPCVLITGAASEREIRRAYEVGARSVLVKPIDFSEYAEMIAHACRYWLQMNLSLNDSRVLRS